MAIQRISVDLIPGAKVAPVINASQYDNGRQFEIELLNGGEAFTPTEGMTIELHVKKRDDTIIINSPINRTNNIITFSTTEQMTACHGHNVCEVSISDGGLLIGTANFILDVEKDPIEGGLTSESEIDNLTQQIEDITQEVIGEDYYNKTETDALLADKADISDLATLASKAELTQAISDEDTAVKNWVSSNFATPGYVATHYYSKLQVDDIINNMLPVGSASGNPCIFDTEYPYLIQGLKAEIVCGGGGGTPSTPIQLVGHSELNLANVDDTTAQFWSADKGFDGVVDFNQLATGFVTQTVDDLTVTNNNDGSITVNGTASANGDMNITSYIHFLSTHKYLINGYKKVGSNNGSFSFSGVGTDSGNGNIWNNDLGDINLLLRFAYSSGDTFNNVVMYPQIYDLTQMFGASIADYIYTLEQGQAGAGVSFFKHFYPDDYYAYNVGETQTLVQMPYTVAFGQTVYGGVYDKTGRLTITWGAVDLGTLDWIYDSGLQRFQTTVSGIKRASGISDLATGILCEALIANSDPVMLPTQRVDNSICRYTDNDNVYVLCSAYSDAETFKTAMNGIMLTYELATPIVIDVLSISVFAENGTNNIVSDCGGDVNVSYKDTIQHYIDSRI